MKPLKFLTLLFLLCLYLKGQSQDAELIDSNQFNLSYKIMVDSCLKNVNLDAVPYGILLEKAFAIQDIAGFNGDISTCDTALHFAWRRAYGCIRRAFVDSTQAYLIGSIVATNANGIGQWPRTCEYALLPLRAYKRKCTCR